jgi:hypothetical protein
LPCGRRAKAPSSPSTYPSRSSRAGSWRTRPSSHAPSLRSPCALRSGSGRYARAPGLDLHLTRRTRQAVVLAERHHRHRDGLVQCLCIDGHGVPDALVVSERDGAGADGHEGENTRFALSSPWGTAGRKLQTPCISFHFLSPGPKNAPFRARAEPWPVTPPVRDVTYSDQLLFQRGQVDVAQNFQKHSARVFPCLSC